MLYYVIFIFFTVAVESSSSNESDCNFSDLIKRFCQEARLHLRIIKSNRMKATDPCTYHVLNDDELNYEISLINLKNNEKCYLINGSGPLSQPSKTSVFNIDLDSSCMNQNGTHALGTIKVEF